MSVDVKVVSKMSILRVYTLWTLVEEKESESQGQERAEGFEETAMAKQG